MSQALDTIFQSLADSTRRDILQRLCYQELSVTEIASNYEMSMPAVSKHIKVLENAGLINRRREGKRFMLHSNPAALKTVDEWITFYRRFWMESFSKMDKYLTTLQKETTIMEQKKTDANEELQLSLDFEFDAPIDLVFDALTKPEHIKHWHSPDHLDITFAEADAVVGGEYRIGVTVVGGDGTEMMFVGKYLEIDRPELLVYSQAFSPGNDAPLTAETTIRIELEEDDNKTLMKFTQTGFDRRQALAGARASWPQAYAKLREYLETLTEEK